MKAVYTDPKILKKLHSSGMSLRQMGKELNLSSVNVRLKLLKLGLRSIAKSGGRIIPNQIILKKTYGTLIITNKKGETSKCLFSLSDLKFIKSRQWHFRKDGYIACKEGLMHRLLLKPKPLSKVDHWSGVRHDNRRKNLQIVTDKENAQNMLRSDHRGISKHRETKWRAYINIGKRQKHLGVFDDKKEALTIAKQARKKHFTNANERRHSAKTKGSRYV